MIQLILQRILTVVFLLSFNIYLAICQVEFLDLEKSDEILYTPNFKVVEILDGRKEKTKVGAYQKDKNTIVNFKFRNNLCSELIQYLSQHQKVGTQAIPIILKISRFWIGKQYKEEDEEVSAELGIHLFTFDDSDRFYYVFDTIAFKESKNLIYNAKSARNYLIQTIYDCLNSIRSVNKNDFFSSDRRVEKEIVYSSVEPLDFECLRIKNDDFTEGIYWSIEDFKNNTPDTVTKFRYTGRRSNVNDDTFIFDLNNEKTSEKIEDHWGFCTQDGPFIYFKGKYHQLIMENNKYVFYGTKPKDEKQSTQVSLLFGLIGYLVDNSIQSKKEGKYIIDLDYETIKPGLFIPKGQVKGTLYLYTEHDSEFEDSINITVNDTIRRILFPAQFHTIPILFEMDHLEICMEHNGRIRCITEENLTYNKDVYIECGVNEKNNKVEIFIKNQIVQHAEYHMNKIEEKEKEIHFESIKMKSEKGYDFLINEIRFHKGYIVLNNQCAILLKNYRSPVDNHTVGNDAKIGDHFLKEINSDTIKLESLGRTKSYLFVKPD